MRLPRKGNSNSHGARPVHQIITMIKRMRTSNLSMKNFFSAKPNERLFSGNETCHGNALQGNLVHKNSTPPNGFHRALGIVLLQGLGGALFLMGEVPLHYC